MRPIAALLACTLIGLAAAPAQAAEYALPNPWQLEPAAMAQPLEVRPVAGPAAWAPAVTAAPTLVLNGLAAATAFGLVPGNPFYLAMTSMAISPMSLVPGYAMVGEPGRGGLVALGGAAVEVVGAIGTALALASLSRSGEGSGYGFFGGLFIGPVVANTLYATWAAYDVQQIAQRKAEGTW